MNKHFSQKGFVHFKAKVPMDEDYKEGTPYMFNETEKTFGKCGLVFNSEEASKISNEIAKQINTK